MSKATFQLIYDGPSLIDNEMEVRDLSSALMAMHIVLDEADTTVNRGKTEATLKVKASFKTGSFKIDLVSAQQLADKIKDLLVSDPSTAVLNAAGLLGLITGLWAFIKWLRGRRYTKMELVGGKVRIFVSDEFMDVEKATIDLYRNYKLRQALDQAVSPLDREGIDSVAIIQDGKITAEATKQERPYFAVVELDAVTLEDTRRTTHLHLVSPSFQDGNKWRVNDGGSNFFVSVDDQTFIEQVVRGEIEFSASTILKVVLREVQLTDAKGAIKKDCTVEKVIEVLRPYQQMELGISASSSAPPPPSLQSGNA